MRTVAEDSQGAVWFGMAGDGLACLKDHHIQRFRTTNGLSSDFIECLHFDRAGALWIGTFGGGLDRFKDGHFAVINRKQGLPNSVIGDIEEDGRGFFWMSSHGGIIRVSEEELNRCADGKIALVHCQTYGINDGMPTIECSEGLQPAGCETRRWPFVVSHQQRPGERKSVGRGNQSFAAAGRRLRPCGWTTSQWSKKPLEGCHHDCSRAAPVRVSIYRFEFC